MSANGESMLPVPCEPASSLQSQVTGSGPAVQLTSKKVNEVKIETSVYDWLGVLLNRRKKWPKVTGKKQQGATLRANKVKSGVKTRPNPVAPTVPFVSGPILSKNQKRKLAKRKKQSLENSLTGPSNSGTVSNPQTVTTQAKKTKVVPVVQSQVTITVPTKKKKNKRKKKKTPATVNPIITAQVNGNKKNKVSGIVGKSGSVPSATVAVAAVNQVVGGSGQKTATKKKRRNNKRKKNNTTVVPVIKEEEDTTQKSDEQMTKKRKINTSCRPTGICKRPKTAENPIFNPAYEKKGQKEEIRACWSGTGIMKTQDQEEDSATMIKDPFTCCYLPAFLSNPTFLDKVCEELQDLEMISKNNDLYKFEQSSDLKTTTSPHLAGLRRFLYGAFREWLIQVTGIPLTGMVDMSCSKYQYTDVLLCHDDELEGRRVAFILYLVPPWGLEDGGTLDLFDIDEHGQPMDVVHSIVPLKNTFAFFEVSPISFHQVSEVVSPNKVRLTINGWFHGPTIIRPRKYVPPPIPLLPPGHVEEEEVYSWINPQYLESSIQRQVQKEFAEKSALELDNFFSSDRFTELAQALHSLDLPWTAHGPANRQSCLSLKVEDAPEVVRSAVALLKSEAMFLVLSQLTGLRLHPLALPDSDSDSEEECGTEPDPRGTVSVRRWGHGNYTLVRDDCVEDKSALDAHLFVNVPKGWTQEHGGFVSYISKDEDEELLTVMPRENCLSLVYRDAETLSFTKYINHRVTELGGGEASYQTLTGVYYE